jgi:hypothetical protein
MSDEPGRHPQPLPDPGRGCTVVTEQLVRREAYISPWPGASGASGGPGGLRLRPRGPADLPAEAGHPRRRLDVQCTCCDDAGPRALAGRSAPEPGEPVVLQALLARCWLIRQPAQLRHRQHEPGGADQPFRSERRLQRQLVRLVVPGRITGKACCATGGVCTGAKAGDAGLPKAIRQENGSPGAPHSARHASRGGGQPRRDGQARSLGGLRPLREAVAYG